MSKVTINMTPNPSDIQTIHCSQGDTEAREWEFELHNNGEVIDASEIADQITFKAYEGGTEEILPNALMNGSVDLGSLDWSYTDGVFFSSESVGKTQTANAQPTIFCIPFVAKPVGYNGAYSSEDKVIWQHPNASLRVRDSAYTSPAEFKSAMQGVTLWYEKSDSTPTTSPFDGTIKYPSGSVDSYFTYRESPTEEDGLAKITGIKGNTIVWNQQIDSSQYRTGTYSSVAVTKSADETYLIANGTASATAYIRLINVASVSMISGHKYCCVIPTDSNVAYYDDSSPRQYSQQFSSFVFTSNGNPIRPYARIENGIASTNRRISFMMFDLTQMGLDSITDPSEFTSLFPLPYYSYNQGSLLSFNGNGIKTVGKNLCDGRYNNLAFGNTVIQGQSYRGYTLNVSALKGKQITVSRADTTSNNRFRASFFSVEPVNLTPFERGLNNGNEYYTSDPYLSFTLTVPDGANYLLLYISNDGTEAKDLMIEIGSTASDYEPYTSSTSSLPISTYFPNGMDGVGTAYDELTNTKASKRMTRIDLGTLSFFYNESAGFFSVTIPNLVNGMTYATESPNVMVQNYEYKGGGVGWANMPNMSYGFNGQNMRIKNTAYTTTAEFINAVRGTYMVYELDTYEETSFTTASLVTENAEIPLSNEDGVLIGKCTEQLSENPGFIDAKIKLSDADGECYSNKIQLHIERSPQ